MKLWHLCSRRNYEDRCERGSKIKKYCLLENDRWSIKSIIN